MRLQSSTESGRVASCLPIGTTSSKSRKWAISSTPKTNLCPGDRRRHSKEGQLLCCYCVCSACNALSKNFPQMFSCFAVVIVANDIYISTILVQPCCSSMQSLGSVVVVLNVRFTTNGMCVKNNTHVYVVQAIIE